MKYCSACGEPLTRRWVPEDSRERLVCTRCGITHYQNPRVIVAAAVVWNESLLLCLRAQQPGQGKWQVPSGFLECGETLQAAAARETFEETGVVLEPSHLQILAVTDMPAIDQIAITFRTEIHQEPQLRPNAESLEVAFVPITDIVLEQLAWSETMGDQPHEVLRELRTRQFGIHFSSIESREGAGFRWREYLIASTHVRQAGSGE